jgi:hypothetical protein
MKRISPDTVSGGNDVELVNILNQCIFQWAVLNSAQVNIGKIASESFSKSLDSVLDAAKKKLAKE